MFVIKWNMLADLTSFVSRAFILEIEKYFAIFLQLYLFYFCLNVHFFSQSFPKTTTQALMEQTHLKDDFAEQEPRKAMVNIDTYNAVNIDR